MSDMHSSDAETYSSAGQLVFVPRGHGVLVFPISDAADDDGAQIIDEAARHHVADLIDNNELTPTGYDGHGAPLYAFQLEHEDG